MTANSLGTSLQKVFDWKLQKETFKEWGEDKVGRLAAALSFHSINALAPLIIGVIAIVGLVYDARQAQEQLVAQINQYVGAQGAEVASTILANADRPQLARWAGVLSLLLLIWSASNIFAQLQDSLDNVWGVELRSDLPLMRKITHRLLPLLVVLGVGALLLAAIIGSTLLSALGALVVDVLPGGDFLWQIVTFVISLAVITLLIAIIFKVLPNVKITWADIWPGAALTAVLFVVGQFVLGWYLGRQSGTSLYGAAGSLIILLLWIYYSAQIFLYGAEFTQVYATRYGKGVVPGKDAVARGQNVSAKAAAQAAQSGEHETPVKVETEGQMATGQPNSNVRASMPLNTRSSSHESLAFGGQSSSQLSSEPSFYALILGVIDDGRMLFRQEFRLAEAEFKEMVRKVAKGAALVGGGGASLYATLLLLLAAVAVLLSGIMPAWFALILVGLLVMIEGALMIVWARKRLAQLRPYPKQTIESLSKDFDEVKGHLVS